MAKPSRHYGREEAANVMNTHSRCAMGLDWLGKDTLGELHVRLDELGNLLVDGWLRSAKLKPKTERSGTL